MKIFYKLDGIHTYTRCPYGKRSIHVGKVNVGGSSCVLDCIYNIEIDTTEQYVKCSYYKDVLK